MFLKSLLTVYGHESTFCQPQKGNFPLLDLPGKKVAFLDDWRFDQTVLPYATQCLWYDGSALPIVRPQNLPGASGHLLYRGSAPIFATTKADDVAKLRRAAADDPQVGAPHDANASMVLRRLKVYSFTVRLAKPPRALPYCGRCFSELVLAQGAR